jgi:peptidoglycan hydrolase-like protein with peptidoglycan-binding domain
MGGSPWYKVDASDAAGSYVGTGWINSTALLDQNLEPFVPNDDPEPSLPIEDTEASLPIKDTEASLPSKDTEASLPKNDTEGVALTKRVQQMLSELGYKPGPIDGLMGPKTRSAIQAFQKTYGMKVDGRITDDLMDAMLTDAMERSSADNRQLRAVEPDGPTYSVISREEIPGIKLSLDMRLDRKASEQELAAIARELRDGAGGAYERIFILYYLPGMEPGAGAWATSHYNPGLKVSILGMTIEQEQTLSEEPSTAGDDVIGSWIDDGILGRKITIFKGGGILRVHERFKDGGERTERLVERETASGLRYDFAEGSSTGDHYIINQSGALEIRDNEGLISVARKAN